MILQKASITEEPEIRTVLLRLPLPLIEVPAIVIEREPVPVAVILPAVLAVEREIDPLAADCAGPVYRVLLLLKKPREEMTDGIPQSHGADVGCHG
jgi:hypothetical protein